jgi:hypothetical protein
LGYRLLFKNPPMAYIGTKRLDSCVIQPAPLLSKLNCYSDSTRTRRQKPYPYALPSNSGTFPKMARTR